MIPLLSHHNLIGIDIGTSAVKIVQLTRTKGTLQLSNFGMARLPRETISNGLIINADPLITAIKQIYAKLKIKPRDAAVAVSGNPVIIKPITIDTMNEDELEGAIGVEAAQYIPFDLDEVNIDFQIMGSSVDQPGKMDVLLVAGKKGLISEYVTTLASAGIRARIVDIDVFSMGNMFCRNYTFEEDETVGLIDIGASATNIHIMRNGTSIFNRDVFTAGNQATEDVQKSLSVSFEEAEQLKTGEDIEGINHELLDQTLTRASAALVREILRTIDFFVNQQATGISRILLSGGGSLLQGLDTLLAEKSSAAVEYADPFRNIKCDAKRFDADYLRQIAPFATIGSGLASRTTAG